jgi:hypothetical protein
MHDDPSINTCIVVSTNVTYVSPVLGQHTACVTLVRFVCSKSSLLLDNLEVTDRVRIYDKP